MRTLKTNKPSQYYCCFRLCTRETPAIDFKLFWPVTHSVKNASWVLSSWIKTRVVQIKGTTPDTAPNHPAPSPARVFLRGEGLCAVSKNGLKQRLDYISFDGQQARHWSGVSLVKIIPLHEGNSYTVQIGMVFVKFCIYDCRQYIKVIWYKGPTDMDFWGVI